MLPTREEAIRELELAHAMNPGPWMAHSLHVGEAAELIAKACGMEPERAYICGILHDIGRRMGFSYIRHVFDGYDYCRSKGWGEPARCCLTHSFPVQDIRAYLGKDDLTEEQRVFLIDALAGVRYDDYDRLIILCDALADAGGFCVLEKRFVDTTRRHGISPFTVERWNSTFEIKEHFDALAGSSVYRLLPGIEESIYG